MKGNRYSQIFLGAVLFGAGLFFVFAPNAHAATTVWSGGGGDAFWSTSGNWTSGVPGASDTAQFDGTCSSNCSPNISVGTTVGTIDMQSGYGGTITYSGGGTLTITTITQAAGTLTTQGGTFSLSGTHTLSGGTFNGGGGAISMGTLTVSGGTFTQSSGSLTATTVTVSSGTFTQSGSVTVNGTLTVSGGTFDGSGASTSVTVQKFILSSGTYKASSGTMTVGLSSANDETIFTKSGGTFTAGSGTVRISSTDNSTTTHTLSISSDIAFNAVTLDMNSSSTASITLSVASGSSVTASGTFTQEDGPVNGGVWNVSGNVVIVRPDAAGGTTQFNFTGGNDQSYRRQGTTGTAGNDYEPDGNIFVNKSGGTLSLVNDAADTIKWNANGQSLLLAPTNVGTFSQGSSALTVGNLTVSSGTYSQGSGALTAGSFSVGGWSTATPAVYDASGNAYSPVQVGTQYWLNKNLNVGSRVDGSASQANNATTEKYCYSDTDANCTTNGGLYQWDEAMQYVLTENAQGICPSGWHVPSDAEQYTLENYLITSGQTCSSSRGTGTATYDCSASGTAIKYGGSSGLNLTFGASAYSGWRVTAGTFANSGTNSYFWSSTQYDTSNAWDREFSSAATVGRGYTAKTYGLPVRCIADSNITTSYSPSQEPFFTQSNGAITATVFNMNRGTFTGNGSISPTTLNINGGTLTQGSGTLTATTFNFPVGSTGTFTQNGTIALSSAFTQNAGTFTGGSAAITCQNFTLAGGIFTSTSGVLRFGANVGNTDGTFRHSAGSFVHNNGTVQAYTNANGANAYAYITTNASPALEFYNLSLSRSATSYVFSGSVAPVVKHLLTMDGSWTVITGSVNLEGDLVISPYGTGYGGVINMIGSNDSTYAYTAGTGPAIAIAKSSDSVNVSPAAGTTNLAINGLSISSGRFTAPSGTLTVKAIGNNDVTFSHSGGTFVHNNGLVTLSTYASGTPSRGYVTTNASPAIEFYDFTLSTVAGGGTSYTFSGSSVPTVKHTFTQGGTGAMGGPVNVEGDLVITSTASGGAGPINLVGSNNQTITGSSATGASVVVKKTDNTKTVSIGANTILTSLTLDTINASVFSQGSYTLSGGAMSLVGGTYTQGSGALTASSMTFPSGSTATFNQGGTITVSGAYSQAAGAFSGGSAGIGLGTFSQTGGSFKSTSGTMNVGVNGTDLIFSYSGAGSSFDANNGTVVFSTGGNATNYATNYSIAKVLTFNNLTISNTNGDGRRGGNFSVGASTVTVNEIFTFNSGRINYGAISLLGDLVVKSAAGAGSTVITMAGSRNATYSYETSTYGAPVISIAKDSDTVEVTPAAGTTDFKMNTFSLSSGKFYAPSGTLQMAGGSATAFTYSGGDFIAGTGTVLVNNYIINSSYGISTTKAILLNNLSLTSVQADTRYGIWISNTASFTVAGNFNWLAGPVGGGSITFTGSNFIIGSGALAYAFTRSVFTFSGSGDQTMTNQGAANPLGLVTIDKSSGTVLLASAFSFGGGLTLTAGTYSPGSYATTVSGTLTQNGGVITQGGGALTATTFTINSGTYTGGAGALNPTTLNVSGGTLTQGAGTLTATTFNFPVSSTGTFTQNGTVTVSGAFTQNAGTFTGSSNNTINMTVGTFSLPASSTGVFVAPAGILTINYATAANADTFTFAGGTFTVGTGTVRLSQNTTSYTDTLRISQPITFNDITIDDNATTGSTTLALSGSGSVTVTGTFTHEDGILNGGTWNLKGNEVVRTEANGGTAAITFSGTDDQTYTDLGGDEPNGLITINKTDGRVIALSNVDWNYAGQGVAITSGTLFVSGGYNVNVASGARLFVDTNGAFVMNGSGTLTIGSGSSSISVLNNGKVFLQSGSGCGGADLIRIKSSDEVGDPPSSGTQRTWGGTGYFSMRDLNVSYMKTTGITLTLISSTLSNCDANWVNTGATNCPTQAIQLPQGTVQLDHGTVVVQ